MTAREFLKSVGADADENDLFLLDKYLGWDDYYRLHPDEEAVSVDGIPVESNPYEPDGFILWVFDSLVDTANNGCKWDKDRLFLTPTTHWWEKI